MPQPLQPTRTRFNATAAWVSVAHLVLGTLAVLFSEVMADDDWWVLAPFCFASMFLLAFVIYRTLRATPTSILFETGIFLAISCATYFAFGPLLYVIGPEEAAHLSRSWYHVTAAQSVWLTGLNFFGLGMAGLAYVSFRMRFFLLVSERASRSWSKLSPTTVFIVCVAIGAIAKYLFVLPYELKLIDAVPSNPVRQLGRLLVIALIIGWAYRKSGPWWIVPIVTVLLILEVVTGLLMFQKTECLLGVVASGIGMYLASRRLGILIAVGVVTLMIYVFITPIVTFGRAELVARGGGETIPADLDERLEIVSMYFAGKQSQRVDNEEPGRWWSRLNYLPTQQAAVDLQRKGHGGDDLSRLPWIFVPRTLYPSKPVITAGAMDFNEKVTGARNSSVAAGIFLDGYYNLGWLGFFLASLSYGLMLRIYTSIAEPVVRNRALVMFPLVFIGVYAGLRADGTWLTDVAAPALFVLVGLSVFRIFSNE
jgi:hypothetical protein